ncbi:MAG: YbjQ family protein [Proteobacteria bacterium]|nr:YbjQ family protein [Pseudomonadota bacterium]
MKDYVEVKNSELGGFIQLAKKSGDWSKVPEVYITREAAGIILTTTFEVAGRRVQHEIEILTAECVYGMNIFRDFFAGVRDVVGGRSAATQKVLRDARRTCLTELRREALMIGADAVIGVNLAYSEFSGAGLSGKTGMLFLVASGTAVKLRKDGDTD